MQGIESSASDIIAFIRQYREWATLIVFVLAFLECTAFVSWLISSPLLFAAIGAVSATSGLGHISLALAIAAGAGCGFSVSYWIGLKLGPRTDRYWPFRDHPEWLSKGHAFFQKWGVLGVFIGHFAPPVRGVIAIVAGIVAMPSWQFQVANWLASFAWGFSLLYAVGRISEFLAR